VNNAMSCFAVCSNFFDPCHHITIITPVVTAAPSVIYNTTFPVQTMFSKAIIKDLKIATPVVFEVSSMEHGISSLTS
jgi:hypothetical protein